MWRFYDSSGRQKITPKPTLSLVTSLPSSPVDGDEILFTDSLTAGTYHWHFRYVAARASNKWVFIGGAPLSKQADPAADWSTGTQVGATGRYYFADSSWTTPVAGVWQIEGVISNDNDADGNHGYGATFNGTTLITDWQQQVGTSTAGFTNIIAPYGQSGSIAASTVIGLAGGTSAKKATKIVTTIRPVAVGG